LALVGTANAEGWYLMQPPPDVGRADIDIFGGVQQSYLDNWQIQRGYDTAEACEAGLAADKRWAAGASNNFPQAKYVMEWSQCIGASDPRLRAPWCRALQTSLGDGWSAFKKFYRNGNAPQSARS
jgi:hypothetical protein